MQISIKSGPDSHGTKILGEDGTEIQGITSMDVRFRPNAIVKATLELMIMDVSIGADAKFIGPNGKEIAKIIYADGTEDVY